MHLTRIAAVLTLLAVSAPACWAAQVPEMVRHDWYLRESLCAIRDWESVLADWENATPQAARTPVLPVPLTGEAVTFPLPIPLTLMPPWDKGVRVQARLDAGKLIITRAPGGEAETIASDAAVVAYHHPGGGGKDRWYHAYLRRFDGLLTFQARSAPFALEIDTPLNLHRGPNNLTVSLRSVTNHPLTVKLGLRLLTPGKQQGATERECSLAAGQRTTLTLPLTLSEPGGGLAILSLETDGTSYWLPILTDVEDIPSVLTSLQQILADAPDRAAGERLAALCDKVSAWRADAPHAGDAWRGLFEDASALREELLLRRLDFRSMLLVKREAYDSEQPYMDAHHLLNRPGGGIYRLEPARPDGHVTPVIDTLGTGIYRDVCLHWDAGRFLFSFGNGSDNWDGSQSYHIYEARADGTGVRQLTTGPKNDCEPFYLPDGQTGFTSDRPENFVMCGGPRHVANLHVMNADGSDIRQLGFNMFNEFNPSVLPDGRIIYTRWEYNERSVTSLHKPFTMRPDGTMVAPYYGNATIRPNVVMFPRAVPGSRKIMALFTAHHGQTHGPIGLIDTARGVDGDEPVTLLTPNVPVTGEKAVDSSYGWYSDPVPLSEDTYLCSYTPTVVPWTERAWALYVGDRYGNLALVYRDPAISCAEPVPLVPRPRPQVLPPPADGSDTTEGEATLMVMDVGRGLAGVPPEAPRFLRVVEDIPRKGVHQGGVVLTSATSTYSVKRMVGTVPIDGDGSARFTVPVNRNVYFEVLDKDRREIQRMRSIVCLKPGETRTCVGCHEPRTTAPPVVRSVAFRRASSTPAPPPWGTRIVSFLRDVQPLLNDQCIQCHTHDRTGNRVVLTDDLTDSFCVAYEELVPYLSVANAMRWDNPEDVEARPAYSYGSRVSPLIELLDGGHHGVKLSAEENDRLANWIDANGVYYDRYESAYGDNRSIFSGPGGDAVRAVSKRRCASCHDESDGRFSTWWLSLNRRDVRLSRALQAPLAKAAGGWGGCDGVVFATTQDSDYQALLQALSDLRARLARQPREDLLSLVGTEAEAQKVTLPPPPLRRARSADLPDGWVSLMSLKWEAATAGWTPNGDGLPRRNLDVEDKPLMLGARRYAAGIGTHAPSEIIYSLGGQYTRFAAIVGGAEYGGTIVFQVWGDDRQLFDSGVMHGLQGTKEVDVSVAGVRKLRLVVTDAGDGYGDDMANWAAPRLLPVAGAKTSG